MALNQNQLIGNSRIYGEAEDMTRQRRELRKQRRHKKKDEKEKLADMVQQQLRFELNDPNPCHSLYK